MADRKVAAREAIFVFNEVLGTLDELAPRRAGPQHSGKVGLSKDIAEEAFGIARYPTIALSDRPFGINRDELIGTILFPDARQSRRPAGEVVNQCVKRTKRHSDIETALHPDIEQPRKETRQLACLELKSAFNFPGGTTWKWRVDLEVSQPEFLREIAIKVLRARVETALVQHGDDADLDPGGLRFAKLPCPQTRIGLGAAVEQFPMMVGIVHGSSETSPGTLFARLRSRLANS